MEPLVSVVISTHNRSHLLRRAIESVIYQSYSNLEIIVSDDASSDDTALVVKSYIERFPRRKIIYRVNSENSGACVTRNAGIALVSGDFVTGLDDDDSFAPHRIEEMVRNFDCSYSFLCTNINVIDTHRNYSLFYGKNKVINLTSVLWKNSIGNQVFVETKKIREVGGFDEGLTSAQDIDLWIRLIQRFGPAFRLKSTTYNLHLDHDEPRITTSSRKLEGLNSFIFKHQQLMGKSQLKFHKLRYEYWKNNRMIDCKYFRYLDAKVCLFLGYLLIDAVRKRMNG